MSLFLRQLSKLCVRFSYSPINSVFHPLYARRANSCFFSSVPQFPYLLLSPGVHTPDGIILKPKFLDPTKKQDSQIVCGGQIPIPNDCSFFVGASQGWTMKRSFNRFYLTDGYKPWVSSPTCIPLPNRVLTPDNKLDVTDNILVSLSSSDPAQDDDCFVATKFFNSKLSVCRPRDSKWTHIRSQNSVFPASTMMYSKRYKAFCFTCPNAFYLSSVELSNKRTYKLKCRHLRLENVPKNVRKKWIALDKTCDMSNHLVESPSGDLFYIIWFTKVVKLPAKEDDKPERLIRTGPKWFMVFREDESSKIFNYTEDIGDLCIFLGMNEAFCVSENMYPGLKRNSIYYSYPDVIDGLGVGCYSLASARTTRLTSGYLITFGICWIQPSDPVA